MTRSILSSTVSTTHHLEFPEWHDVVRNEDGSVKNPATEINIHVIVDLCFLAWIGSPFNLKIVFRILGDKLLRDRSRYIIQLSTMISSLCVLLTNFFSIALFIFRVKGRGVEIEGFCHFYVVTAGWSYISLLFNICMSLLDSFVAVVFPMAHQRKLTPRRVVLSLVALNLAIGLIVNHHFITGGIPLRCAIQLDHSYTIRKTGYALFSLCVLFYGVNYYFAWKVIPAACRPPPAAAVAPPPLPPPPVEELIELDDVTAAAAAARLVSRQQVEEEDVVFIHRPPTNPRQPIDPLKSVLSSATTHRKVELEATRNYLFLISPFFLLPLPFIAYLFVYHFACPYMKLLAGNFPHQQQQQQDEASMMICHDFTWLIPYFIPVLMSMFTLINPIMNLLINTDFRSTSAVDYLPPHLVPLDY